ncbi:hypothetical protein EDD17DRAFT_385556 [Pisolithus thermaeus]|nr:hypothetical protein EDD17DRAFT_385556 [Pisolithus thermaeus]
MSILGVYVSDVFQTPEEASTSLLYKKTSELWVSFQEMSPSHNASEDNHFHGSPDGQPSLASALGNPNGAPCPKIVFCFQQVSDTQLCYAEIACGSVSQHMRHKHGVSAQPPTEHVVCKWQGCRQSITRKNIYRHIQEKHLEHKRGVGHVSQE